MHLLLFSDTTASILCVLMLLYCPSPALLFHLLSPFTQYRGPGYLVTLAQLTKPQTPATRSTGKDRRWRKGDTVLAYLLDCLGAIPLQEKDKKTEKRVLRCHHGCGMFDPRLSQFWFLAQTLIPNSHIKPLKSVSQSYSCYANREKGVHSSYYSSLDFINPLLFDHFMSLFSFLN